MRKLVLCTLLSSGLLVTHQAAAAEPVCSGPPTVSMSLPPKVTDISCDGLCGGLTSIGLSGPVASGTPVSGGQLQYVDGWHGRCKIVGGPLAGKCQADTKCMPGWQKFEDGGVWKCKQTITRVVPNPELLACIAKADSKSGKKYLTASQRASAARAAFGRQFVEQPGWSNAVRDKWTAWNASLPLTASKRDVVLDGIQVAVNETATELQATTKEVADFIKQVMMSKEAVTKLTAEAGKDKVVTKAEQKEIDEAKARENEAAKKRDEAKARQKALEKLKADLEQTDQVAAFARKLIESILASFPP